MVPGDVQKVELDDLEDVADVVLEARLWNALPMAGTVRLLAARDSLSAAVDSRKGFDTLCAVTLPPAILSTGAWRARVTET